MEERRGREGGGKIVGVREEGEERRGRERGKRREEGELKGRRE